MPTPEGPQCLVVSSPESEKRGPEEWRVEHLHVNRMIQSIRFSQPLYWAIAGCLCPVVPSDFPCPSLEGVFSASTLFFVHHGML